MNPFGKLGRIVAMILSLVVFAPVSDIASAQVPSGSTPSVAGVVPTNTAYPAITGTARVPNTLTVNKGTWGGSPTSFEYAWYRCTVTAARGTAKPAACTAVEGRTATTYVLSADDVNKFIVASVKAINASGSLTRWSAATAKIVAQYLPPANTVAPAVTGNKTVSQTLTVSNGTWTESPSSFGYKWYRCSATKAASNTLLAGCAEIAGQTAATYTLVTADATKFIVAAVTATNQATSVTKWSASTTVVAALARPANTVAPVVTGTVTNSMTLSASTGTWSNFPTYTYQWVRCNARVAAAANALPAGCVAISGATSSTYALTDSDVTKFIGVSVTATNTIGSAQKWSATSATAVAALPAPVNTVTPTLSGSAQVSRVLTLNIGTWNYRPTSYSYKWYSCTAAKAAAATLPAGCTQIAGAVSSTYQLLAAQSAKFILGSVTATNVRGSASRFTATTTSVTVPTPYAPSALIQAEVGISGTSGDAISGKAMVGSVLVADEGTWLGYPVPTKTFSYWYRCAAEITKTSTTQPDTCYVIEDSQGDLQHVVTLDDLGSHLLYEIIATNTQGVVRNYTPSTSAVTATPVAYVQPSLSGGVNFGETIDMDGGSWATPPTVGVELFYSWYRCLTDDPAIIAGLPAECEQVDDATESSYTVGEDDLGTYLFGVTTAFNDFDESASATATTLGLSVAAPEFTDVPTVSGLRVSGEVLTVDDAVFVAYPEASIAVQWYRCTAAVPAAVATIPATCSAISGETASTYTLTASDLSRFITARTTITNTVGSVSSLAATSVAAGSVPAFTVAPVVSGTTVVGSTLSVTAGTATGTPIPTRTYQWLRCSSLIEAVANAVPDSCTLIPGATSTTYVSTINDAGKAIAVRVTAANPVASTVVVTISSAEIDVAPTRGTAPQITGTRTQGETLTVSDGTWTAHPAPTLSYQWLRCTAAVPANTFTIPATCSTISGAVSSSYVSTSSDLGKYVTAIVTASNTRGSLGTVAPSAINIASIPSTVSAPTVSGTPTRGQTLTATQISWTATPTPSVSLQWYRCSSPLDAVTDAAPDGCATISGATSTTYLIVDADAGKYLTVASVATNIAGTSKKFGLSTTVIQSLPTVSVAPTISGDRWIGSELTVVDGTWFEYPEATVTYQWYRCSSPVVGATAVPVHCSEAIANATTSAYTLDGADAGKYLTAVVEHTNTLGTSRYIAAQSIATFLPPSIDTEPSLTGTPALGSTLTLDEGLWTGYPAPTVSHSWVRCETAITSAVNSLPSDCSNLSTARTKTSYSTYQISTGLPSRNTSLYPACTTGQVDQINDDWASGSVFGCRADYVMVKLSGTMLFPTSGTRYFRTYGDDGTHLSISGTGVVNNWTNGGARYSTSGSFTFVANQSYNFELWYFEAAGLANVTLEYSSDNLTWQVVPSSIFGASPSSRTRSISADDVGRFITAQITAANSGSVTNFVLPTTTAVTAPPTATTYPTSSGNRLVGQQLTLDPGVFVEYPVADEISYKWYRCSTSRAASTSASDSCYLIAGENDLTYNQTSDDAGYYVAGAVTRTNEIGTTTAWSSATSTTNQAPLSVIDGYVDGDPVAGSTLIASEGMWQGFPVPSLQFQWYRCAAEVTSVVATVPAGCATISAATSSSYLLAPADMGYFVTFAVTRSNTLGSVTRVAQSTAIVTGVPVVVSAPTVSGTRTSGSTLSVSTGSWLAFPSAESSRQWYRCNSPVAVTESTPAGCAVIEGETGATYTQTLADAGKYLTVATTQSNANGAKTVWSSSSATSNYPPTLVTEPTISGTPAFTSTLSANVGEWLGFPAPTTTYQWYRCATAVDAESSTASAGCDAISTLGTSPTYTAVGPDMGKYLILRVTQTNLVAASTRFTRSTEIVTGVPAAQIAPEIAGVRAFGQTLNVTNGTWWSYPAISDTVYQWYRCSIAVNPATATIPGTCVAIDGETASSYTLTAADSGSYVTASVARTNTVGTTTMLAAQTTANTQAPTNTVDPTITGTINMGELLTVSTGEWQGFPRPTYTYEWLECTGEVASASNTRPAGCTEFQSDATISAGSTHTCVAQSDGTLYCWGVSTGAFSTSTPTAQSGTDKVIQVAVGVNFTCYLLVDSSVKCWGVNGSGQLGDGSTTTRTTPVVVTGLRGVKSLTAGDAFMCALMLDGTVKCWGNNGSGQLGLGNTTSQSTPQTVIGLTNVVSLDAGQSHSCAVISGGTAKCWGAGTSGQIGDGQSLASAVNRTTPTSVSTIASAVTITAGGNHSCVVLTTGGVRCWGMNSSGQLGNVSTANATSPVGPLGMTSGVASVSAGGSHTCAVLIDGTAKCWGSNASGQLGTGNTSPSSIPVTVSGLSGVSMISGGASHSCVVHKSGAVSCWGLNTSGQIGDGTTASPRATATLRTFNLTKVLLDGNEFGKYLLSAVTATNSIGAVTDFSASTNLVSSIPFILNPPSLSAGSTFGTMLTATTGSWASSQTISVYNYQWYRCSSPVNSVGMSIPITCSALVGATSSSYELTADDSGKYITVVVTAVASTGQTSVMTTSNGPITVPPTLVSTPVLTGDTLLDFTQSVSTGAWVGHPTIAISYSWYRCPSANPSLVAGVPTGCTVIVGATSATYLNTAADLGYHTLPVVRASNTAGSVSITVNSNGVISTKPRFTNAPTVSGTRAVGQVLTVGSGAWEAYPAAETSYQWYRCDSALTSVASTKPAQCSVIADATSRTYSQSASDVGRFVTAATIKSNSIGDLTVWSTTTLETNSAPVLVAEPSVSGISIFGSELEISSGTWNAFPLPTTKYGWTRCSEPIAEGAGEFPAGCIPVLGPVSLDSGTSHTCSVQFDGTIRCWGLNSSGQLGDGTTTQSTAPVLVSGISNAIQVSSGGAHTCALLSDKTVKCWGYNASPRLGDGTTTNRATAVSVIGVNNAVSISAGGTHTCALIDDGTVKCWGDNTYGQVGDGTTTSRTQPALVAGILNAQNVVAGGSHTCALIDDGTVKCWGSNFSGQIGDGTRSNRISPTQVLGISNAEALSAGSYNTTCAALDDGTARCWGSNVSGAIGNGNSIDQLEPTTVFGLSNVVDISVGEAGACAKLTTGELRCWGNNDYGQLGNGTVTRSMTAITAIAGVSVDQISTGDRHVCAILASGILSCWGANTNGQIGDGSTTNRLSSISISSLTQTMSDKLTISAPLLGLHIGASVTVTNFMGTASRWLPTVYASSKPVLLSEILISGSRTTGEILTTTAPVWAASPQNVSVTRQWVRCDSQIAGAVSEAPSDCTEIGGATADTYTLTSADEGKYVSLATTLQNSVGTLTVWSGATAISYGRATFTSNGTWTVPSGVSQVTVLVVGGGGRGADKQSVASFGAGGGGAAVFERVVAVTAGEVIPVIVGVGGNTAAPGHSQFLDVHAGAGGSAAGYTAGAGYTGDWPVPAVGSNGGGQPVYSSITGQAVPYGGGGGQGYRPSGSTSYITGPNGAGIYGYGGGGAGNRTGWTTGLPGGGGIVVVRWISEN